MSQNEDDDQSPVALSPGAGFAEDRRVSADEDPQETSEWLESLDAVAEHGGSERAAYLLARLQERARELQVRVPSQATPYRNTIPPAAQPPYPGRLPLEMRIDAINRWNAMAMVVRANHEHSELGGHIATYASIAEILEVGQNHFFRGADADGGGDLVFFQPHAAPGVYARAFLEGRLTEENLRRFRREAGGGGLSSYPHPWLMPGFWQFPTGSMGLGAINAIYQARFMRYLQARGLADTRSRHVWGFFGDGEMDEPESIAGLAFAAREQLDNLTFVINCNLQRLDGPVRGNGLIIQELEALFAGAGWNVIKVLWGSNWDALFARDTGGVLVRRFASMVDGEFQTLGANDGVYNLNHFFTSDPELRALAAGMTPEEVDMLQRGGHDMEKLYAAFQAARTHTGRPTVILAKTKKGYGLGRAGESRMAAHQQKKPGEDAIAEMRDRFGLPLTDEDVAEVRFYRPAEDSPEVRYVQERRKALGGYLPERRTAAEPVRVPPLPEWGESALAASGRQASTTMAAVQMLGRLLRDETLGPRVVPIVADEARTFGMAALFRQVGIYSPSGQLYEPEDADLYLYYREDEAGQILEEGITEAGALASWTAAATSYSAHGISMLPFYMYYSIFGFQRVGDLIWAAADQRARGFLIGGTAGRTTLSGEGLQHQDGTSHVMAATIPTCRAYDPAFAYELAVILDHGMRQMLEDQEDVFYYLTVTNETIAQPSLPAGVEDGIVRGMYRLAAPSEAAGGPTVRLLGCGAIHLQVSAAAELLASDWGIASETWSVTSFSELARDARGVERWNRLHPTETPKTSYVETCLPPGGGAVVAATDYVRAYPQLIAPWVRDRFAVLGTDGFGRSGTRQEIRRFFEVDAQSIVVAALDCLARDGELDPSLVADAIEKYGLDRACAASWER